MKHVFKRTLSLMLALALLFSLMAVPGYATGNRDGQHRYHITFTPAGGALDWVNIFCYYWVENADSIVDWPGTQMTQNGSVWELDLELSAEPTNLIFDGPDSGGTTRQTANLPFASGDALTQDSSGSYGSYTVEEIQDTADDLEITVCDGTDENSNVPVHGLWADAYLKCQFVILGSELEDAESSLLKAMRFYTSSHASEAWTGTFKVYVSAYNEDTIDAYQAPSEDNDLVYAGTLDGTGATMEIVFTSPVQYNGGNLLITVNQTVKGNFKSVKWYGKNLNGRSIQGHNSSFDAVAPSQQNFVPKTTFTYEPVASDCPHTGMSYVPEVPPTCSSDGSTTDGTVAHYHCPLCNKNFSDAEGSERLSAADMVIPGHHNFDDGVVTAPTATDEGYTTYTCSSCGYSYQDNFTDPLGYDYTVHFSVPADCAPIADMVSNSLSGITLPTVADAPDSYQFLGWVSSHVTETTEKPAEILKGHYTAAEEITLYALFKRVDASGTGETGFELVTNAPSDWSGRYVISMLNNENLNVMKGLGDNVSYETESNGGAVSLENADISLDGTLLSGVAEDYIFQVEQDGSGNWTIQSVATGCYVTMNNSYLKSRADNDTNFLYSWTLALKENGNVEAKIVGTNSYPYLSSNSGHTKFYADNSTSEIYFWAETAVGTTYYTTELISASECEHELVAHPAVAPTCGEAGNIAYWKCSICYNYFADEDAQELISYADTIVPPTGEHSFSAWSTNGDGTHTHVCAVCELSQTASCSYDDGVVTPPTAAEQGYTTYTCTLCGYAYQSNYVDALGYDYTVRFSVPPTCTKPADMVSNTNTGITLPTVEAPEGYSFTGWVEHVYDNVESRPAEVIHKGHYVASDNITLIALFKRVEASGTGGTGFELVTDAPSDWSGRYVISMLKDADLKVMKGLGDNVSYESSSNGGAVSLEDAHITLSDTLLSDVAEDYIFQVAQDGSGNWTIQSVSTGCYVTMNSGYLKSRADNDTDFLYSWTLALMEEGNVEAMIVGTSDYPYLGNNNSYTVFWSNGSTSEIYFWAETAVGTTYWTTIIGEPDPGEEFTVSFTVPAGLSAPAAMTVNSLSGAELPTLVAPEGYRFLGWVLEDYDNVMTLPDRSYTGLFRPTADVTFKALFHYSTPSGEEGFRLVTEDMADWSGNYLITCNDTADTMIFMHGVAADVTYESPDSNSAFLYEDAGFTLTDDRLTCNEDGYPENYVFQIAARGAGSYSIRNLGSGNFVGRNVTTAAQSARLWSYGTYQPDFCRWSFTWGDHGSTNAVNNVLIKHVDDVGYNGSYPYLGCGMYYYFAEGDTNKPYFWVDGAGDSQDSDIYYMYLWKDVSTLNYYTTIIGEEETLDDGYYLLVADTWTIADLSADDLFVPNPNSEGEYQLINYTLEQNQALKVVKVENGEITAWYPNGMGDEYFVDEAHAGQMNIYFRPTGGNADWAQFGGYMWIGTYLGEFTGYSLYLDGDIRLDFYVDIPDYVDLEDAKVVFTWGNNKTSTFELSNSTVTPHGCKVWANVAAAEMTDEITATLLVNDNVISVDHYSVAQYAQTIINDEDGLYTAMFGADEMEELVPLCQAMLVYGGKAQLQFGYNTDDLASSEDPAPLTDDELLLLPGYNIPTEELEALYGIRYYGSTLLLNTRTTYRLYFVVVDEEKFETLQVSCNGEEIGSRSGRYAVYDIANIAAAELLSNFSLEFGTVVFDVNAGDYIGKALNSGNDTLAATVTALYRYHRAAVAYFNR